MSGEADFYVGTLSGLAQHIQAGRITPLLFTVRNENFAAIPIAAEVGVPNSAIRTNFGFYTTAGVPRDAVQRLSGALAATSKTPEVVDAIRKLGLDIYYTTPEQQQRELEAQIAFFIEAARIAKYEPQ